MAATTEVEYLGSVEKATWDALLALTGGSEAMLALAEKSEELLDLAEKSEELLDLLDEDATEDQGQAAG